MSWRDRLKKSIKFVSPEENTFEAQWVNNSISLEKKIGIFNYPKVKGSKIQDLDIKSPIYPLTIFFEGADNDLEAIRFFKACGENGLWSVDHPVLGLLNLQLISVSPDINPIKSGNITQFTSEWIEPIDDSIQTSTPQLASEIENRSDEVNSVGSEQFKNNIIQDTSAQIFAVETTTNKIVDITVTRLKSLYETVPEINAQMTSIIRSIQDTITQTTIDTLSLAGQIQNLIQLPILASNDIATRLSLYGSLILDVLGLSPDLPTKENKNIISVQELTLTAVIVSLSQISSSGILTTRSKAIESAENISDLFIDITNDLDLIQELYINNDIDLQYFSQSASFSDASIIIAISISYLLLASFDLAIEKRFILDRPRSSIEITITEYGTLGVDDSNYDLFIESNKLKRNDILLLPSGREVVVYV